MSLMALNWALAQKNLKPITKLILIHLADRHNPDIGCFPSQSRLAEDAEVSRSTVNRHLDILESRRLIKRSKRDFDEKGLRMSTQYFLGFENSYHNI